MTCYRLRLHLLLRPPCRSCERALNEHASGLLRQFVPKTENLRPLGPQRLQAATDWFNHRPRKGLGCLAL